MNNATICYLGSVLRGLLSSGPVLRKIRAHVRKPATCGQRCLMCCLQAKDGATRVHPEVLLTPFSRTVRQLGISMGASQIPANSS